MHFPLYLFTVEKPYPKYFWANTLSKSGSAHMLLDFTSTYARFLSSFTLASPGTKIYVENILSKNVCFGFSFRTIIALALQTNAIRVAFSILPYSRDSKHASNKQEIFRCISTSSSSIDKACYIIRRICTSATCPFWSDTHFQLVD